MRDRSRIYTTVIVRHNALDVGNLLVSLNLWGVAEKQFGWAKCLEIDLRVRCLNGLAVTICIRFTKPLWKFYARQNLMALTISGLSFAQVQWAFLV